MFVVQPTGGGVGEERWGVVRAGLLQLHGGAAGVGKRASLQRHLTRVFEQIESGQYSMRDFGNSQLSNPVMQLVDILDFPT